MAFSEWSENFSKNFGKWGWSAGEAGQGYKGKPNERWIDRSYKPAKAPVRYAPTVDKKGSGGLTSAALAAYQKAIAQYQPGGGFMKGIEAGLERGRTKSMASGMQSLVSSGLSNTTTAAGLGKKYEEEVGAPTRAGAESQRVQGLASLYASLGGAEQGAYEGSAGRGLGYAQLGASQSAQAGQLGLGYAQLGASQSAQAEQLKLSYAQLAASQQPNYYDSGGGGGGYEALLAEPSYFK